MLDDCAVIKHAMQKNCGVRCEADVLPGSSSVANIRLAFTFWISFVPTRRSPSNWTVLNTAFLNNGSVQILRKVENNRFVPPDPKRMILKRKTPR